MIDIVNASLPLLQAQQVLGRFQQVATPKDTVFAVVLEVELLVDLVATHPTEIITLGIKEQALDKGLGVGRSGGISRPETTVDILEGLFRVLGRIFFEALDDDAVVYRRIHHSNLGNSEVSDLADDRFGQRLKGTGHHNATINVESVLHEDHVLDIFDLLGVFYGDVLDRIEQLQDVAIATELVRRRLRIGIKLGFRQSEERPEERGGQELTTAFLAVQVNVKEVAGVELGLIPRSTVRDNPEAVEGLAIRMLGCLESQTRRAVQLADDDTLSTIDNKGALGGHERNFAHEHFFLLGTFLFLQQEGNVKRCSEGQAFTETLQPVDLRLLDVVGVEV